MNQSPMMRRLRGETAHETHTNLAGLDDLALRYYCLPVATREGDGRVPAMTLESWRRYSERVRVSLEHGAFSK